MRIVNETAFQQEEQVTQILTHVKFLDTKISDLIAENVFQINRDYKADFDLKVSKYLLKNLSNCMNNYKENKK